METGNICREKDEKIFCPLYEREIALGKCLDINYERLHYIKYDNLKDLVKIKKVELDELVTICSECSNSPFSE